MIKIFRVFTLAVVFGCPTLVMASGPGVATGTFVNDVGSFNDTSSVGGAFDDSYSFTLPAGESQWDVISPQGTSIGINGFQIALYDGSSLVPGNFDTTTFGGNLLIWSETFASLPAGLYTIDFSGVFKSGGGSYGGTLLVTPVPETSTWLAMFFGLGLMMFTVSRQRKSKF